MWYRVCIFTLVALLSSVAVAGGMTLDYLYRYNCQQGTGVDHLMTALAVGNNRMIVAGYPALALVDLGALPVGGTAGYLDRITGFNARNLYLKDNHVFVNENAMGTQPNQWGFAVVRIDSGDTLTLVKRVYESGALFEKMRISGNYLYVAAHSKGIRIYDITDPTSPAKVGQITTGFTDAFDIAVSGNTAYVADGAGGLKLVDVTNPHSPVLLGGEDTTSSVGTAEAITVRNGKVYMAVGSAGLAAYNEGSVAGRQVFPLGGFAEDVAWVGDYLAISTYPGPVIFDPSSSTIVAREASTRRGSNATLRICVGIGSADNNRALVANWNYVDVYQLKQSGQSTQPDIVSTEQRIRFSAAAGTRMVTVTNNGQATLQITGVNSTSSAFSANYSGGSLGPGQRATLGVSYNGSLTQGSGTIRIASNDVDENPQPIQVYGNTSYLDPSDPAADFTLPILIRNPDTGQFSESSFTLSQQRGKVVWFAIFGSW